MTTEHTVLRRLTELDPARELEAPTADETDHMRQWVLAHDRYLPAPTPIRRPRRRLALVSAAAAVALGVAIAGVLPGLISGQGATAPASAIPMLTYSEPAGVDAAAELEQLADHIRDTAPPDPQGTYIYTDIRNSGWGFVDPNAGSEGEKYPVESEVWMWKGPDGSVVHRMLHNDRVHQEANGWMEFHINPADLPSHRFDGPPEQVIVNNTRKGTDHVGWELMHAYIYSVRELGQRPAVERAGFFDALAVAGATSYGKVTDRAGREGLSFGATSREAGVLDELRIIVDADTGELLAIEDIYPGHSSGPQGSGAFVMYYTVIVEATRTDTRPTCPEECQPARGRWAG